MALQPGTRLGPYEILAPLGAGGMGEVYRARDSRLGRDVAIKVLPQDASVSPEDRARFKREAKAISSLNHPHICTLHDVGQEGDTDYLVMELVDGETLTQRIARGALPPADVLRLGAQIADALDRAHRAGVIHRDLKPGNVMLVKSGAKLMDFGLARVAHDARRGRALDAAATAPTGAATEEPITAKGTVVGTFQYMAPEQLEGKNADARTDIWALGCVLYEMATGRRAFEGSTPGSLISAIMRDQPREMSELAPLAPPAFERAVRQCLAKDPDDRWQSAGDLGRDLTWIGEAGSRAGVPAPVVSRRNLRQRIVWMLVGVALAGLVGRMFLPKLAPRTVTFELAAPPQVKEVDLPRISPDGRTLAFNATDSSGTSGLWVRPMNSLEARRLPGTEGAGRPFWSPDSRNLGYFAGNRLWRIPVAGGPAVALCQVVASGDGTWSQRGVILFDGASPDTIQLVSASGGAVRGATRCDPALGETGAAWPQFLPDGRHFLYIAYGQVPDSGMLKVGSIDSKKTTTLGPARSRLEYASGYLLYVMGGTLVGRPFNASTLKFTGEPVAVAQNVEADRNGSASFSVSSEGTLAFHSGTAPAKTRLVWVNRLGQRLDTVGPPDYYDMPALSPDGEQLAVRVADPSGALGDLWIWDLSRNLGSRFTFTSGRVFAPAWSPDGNRIAYARANGRSWDIFVKPAGGAGAESLLYTSNENKDVSDWSADGAWILYMAYPLTPSTTAGGSLDIYALALGSTVRPVPVVTSSFLDGHPALSPDGRWLVYFSMDTGRQEIYVQPFRGPGPRWRISTQGGVQPFWRGDGRELFYLGLDGGFMSVTVEPGAPPRFGLPRKLFDSPAPFRFNTRTEYAPSRDGQRFLFVAPEGNAEIGGTTVMLNWPASLPKE